MYIISLFGHPLAIPQGLSLDVFCNYNILTYLIFIVSVHSFASRKNKIFSRVSSTFTIISSAVLLSNYFIQFSVIPASLMNGDENFISVYCPVFINNNRIEISIRWIFIIAFIMSIIAFALVIIKYGIVRKDRFEVMVNSIEWLVLMVNKILTSIVFKRALKQIQSE